MLPAPCPPGAAPGFKREAAPGTSHVLRAPWDTRSSGTGGDTGTPGCGQPSSRFPLLRFSAHKLLMGARDVKEFRSRPGALSQFHELVKELQGGDDPASIALEELSSTCAGLNVCTLKPAGINVSWQTEHGVLQCYMEESCPRQALQLSSMLPAPVLGLH